MASIAEVWKNSGKAAWRKRINKIKRNAKFRKPPKNELDVDELSQIASLEAKIAQREAWEEETNRLLKQSKNQAAAAAGRAAADAEAASAVASSSAPYN